MPNKFIASEKTPSACGGDESELKCVRFQVEKPPRRDNTNLGCPYTIAWKTVKTQSTENS